MNLFARKLDESVAGEILNMLFERAAALRSQVVAGWRLAGAQLFSQRKASKGSENCCDSNGL